MALLRQIRRVDAGARALRNVERQLRESQKLEALGTLAGGVAHDFNNILAAIMGYDEFAQHHLPEGARVRRDVDQIVQAGGRAKVLVERILALSRGRAVVRRPVDVEPVVREALELVRPMLRAHVTLDATLAAAGAATIGDATELHEIVMNLCTNALHAMDDHGTLTVTQACVNVDRRRLLSNGALAPGPYLRLTVGDTGSGIAPAVRERMFEPFFATRPFGEGTGLGLSLVRGIVTRLEGAIDVASVAGEGTRIDVWLRETDAVAPAAAADASPAPHGHGEVVMIVDDDPALVALGEEMLAGLGYEPVGFRAGVDALQAFRADPGRFDLVLADETMPGLTGSDLARELHRVRPDIPIVLMSGHGGPALEARARSAGVTEIVQKPLTRRDIAALLARVAVPFRL